MIGGVKMYMYIVILYTYVTCHMTYCTGSPNWWMSHMTFTSFSPPTFSPVSSYTMGVASHARLVHIYMYMYMYILQIQMYIYMYVLYMYM